MVFVTPRSMGSAQFRNSARADGGGEPGAGRAWMGRRDLREGKAWRPRTENVVMLVGHIRRAGRQIPDRELRVPESSPRLRKTEPVQGSIASDPSAVVRYLFHDLPSLGSTRAGVTWLMHDFPGSAEKGRLGPREISSE
jgi:hypothetical protein